ncbi:MAG: LysE family transporter [Chloroflexota bacterium]|nr:LysE family transporter [Chloroflexota bacterium]
MKRRFALFSTSLVVGFSGALMPGPLLTAVIAGAARDGFWAGPALSLGHAIAEAGIVLGLAFGLARLFKNRWVSGTIGLVGGLFLLWMGYDIAQSAWTGAVSLQMATSGTASQPGWGSVLTGVVVSVTNPYWILWWATVGANYVLLGMKEGPLGLGSVYTGHILSDILWLVFVSFVVSSGRALMNDLVYRGILLVCSLFLIVLGLYFARSGLRFMRGQGVVPPA